MCVCMCAVCVCHANGVLSRVFTCDCGRTFRRKGDLTRLVLFSTANSSPKGFAITVTKQWVISQSFKVFKVCVCRIKGRK